MANSIASGIEASRLYQAGLSHLQANRPADAEAAFRRALALNDGLAAAHAHLGVALQALNRTDEAIRHFEQALALHPGDAAALNNLGNALMALGRFDDAVARYERALALAPQLAAAHANLGNALHAGGRHDDAMQSFSRALALNPQFARAHMSLGNCLKELEQYDEAIASYERALAIEPDYTVARMNLGKTLQTADRRADAVACYEQVIAREPGNADAHLNLGVLFLSSGRLTEGWPHYEYRWHSSGHAPQRGYAQPRWNGERVQGTLLLWGEQGLGDQALHAGMIAELSGRADEIAIEVEPRLLPLFARSFPHARVVGLGSELYAGPIAAHAPLGSLGQFLRPSFDAFPRRERGYLVPDAKHTRALRERLTADGQRVIGLSWVSRNPEFGRHRSAALRDFKALLRLPGCRFVDLQYGDTEAERAAVERETGVRVEHLDEIDNTSDIDGLAALIAACDAVVTVDNTTVHLAGALGTPAWLLAPHGHARVWYWFDDRDDCPWYPGVRVQRRAKSQSWAELISAVAGQMFRSAAKR